MVNEWATAKDSEVDRFIALLRWGGVLPTLATILVLVIMRIVGGGPSELAVSVGALTAVGQAMVWRGMAGLRGSGAWATGVGFPLFIGGVLSAQTLFLTQIPALMPIPLIAPLVGLVAKWRHARREDTGAAR